MRSKLFSEYIVGTAQGAASQAAITLDAIRAFKFTRPPDKVQRRIADVLSAYDDLIENNTRRIKILEEMARSLYREWFVEFRFPGHENVKFVESEIGRVPKDWKAIKLDDTVHLVRETVDPRDLAPDTPYFGLEHLPRRSTTLGTWGLASDVQSTKLVAKSGDILFAKIRPNLHKVGMTPIDAVCSSDTILLRPRRSEYLAMVLGCVSSDAFIENAVASSHGTKMPRANWDVLKNWPIALPTKELLALFDSVAGDAIALSASLALACRTLSRTRDLLLPRLISGEIELPP